MYEAFYNLTEDPFRMSPDFRFSFPHHSYAKARNYLEFGLLRGEGLVVITGAPGTGKSTVIGDVLDQYQAEQHIQVSRLMITQLDINDLLRMVAYSFGIKADSMDTATVLNRIETYLNRQYDNGNRVLLIIDEAQHLSEQALEQLRLLTNIQRDSDRRLQIFLLGQPQLQNLIRGPAMEQLRQRIVASCHFEPLDVEETRDYIDYRMTIAGWEGDPEITDEACGLIHRYSAGIPRRINLICSRLLLHGAVDEKHRLDAGDVENVLSELPPEMQEAGVRQEKSGSRMSAVPKPGGETAKAINKYKRWYAGSRQAAAQNAEPSKSSWTDAQKPERPAEQEAPAPGARNEPEDMAAVTPLKVEELEPEPAPEPEPANPFATGRPSTAAVVAPAARPRVQAMRQAPRDPERAPAGDRRPPARRDVAPAQPPQRREPPKKGKPRAANAPFHSLAPDEEDIDAWDQVRDHQVRARRRIWVAAVLFMIVFAGTYAGLVWLKGDANADISAMGERFGLVRDRVMGGLSSILPAQTGTPTPAVMEPQMEDTPTAGTMDSTPGPSSPVENSTTRAGATLAATSAPAVSGVILQDGRPVISPVLEEALRMHAIEVKRESGRLIISLQRVVTFKPHSAQLDASAYHALRELSLVLGGYTGFSVNIVGLTPQHDDDEAMHLSRMRARAVADYLLANGMGDHTMRSESRATATDGDSQAPATVASGGIQVLLQPVG